MKSVIFSAALLAATSSFAYSADLSLPMAPVPMDVVESVAYWDGFYAGIVGGYGNGRSTYANTFGVPGSPFPSPDISGGLIGGTLGYNAQFGSFVLGAEGDISWSGITGTGTWVAANDVTSSLTWLGTARVRAGVAFDQVLIYATGGLATGSVRTNVAGQANAAPFSTTHVGFTVGGGAELALTDQFSVKAEYLYTDLGTQNIGTGALFTGSTATTVQTSFHTFRVGANFHF